MGSNPAKLTADFTGTGISIVFLLLSTASLCVQLIIKDVKPMFERERLVAVAKDH